MQAHIGSQDAFPAVGKRTAAVQGRCSAAIGRAGRVLGLMMWNCWCHGRTVHLSDRCSSGCCCCSSGWQATHGCALVSAMHK